MLLLLPLDKQEYGRNPKRLDKQHSPPGWNRSLETFINGNSYTDVLANRSCLVVVKDRTTLRAGSVVALSTLFLGVGGKWHGR